MLIDNDAIILVFNGGQMGLYRNIGNAPHTRLEQINEKKQHIAGTSSLGRQRPGRNFSSLNKRRNTYDDTDLHSQAEEKFIQECLKRLDKELKEKDVAVVLVAPPTALGIARKYYSANIRKSIIAEINRDYASNSKVEIEKYLSAHLIR